LSKPVQDLNDRIFSRRLEIVIRIIIKRALFSLAALFLLAAPALADSPETEQAPKLKILILGGTGFIGPWEVEAALAHGHEVTLFNRGKSKPGMFPDLEKLKGDRDPDKDEGLSALEGREFDVVIDNSGYYPRHVKASAELLGPNVKHYIYISSISAYKLTDVEGQDETAPVATMEDPTVEEMGENWVNYGPLKALCETAAEEAMPGRVTIVRPGYIVGPGDHTHRFTYWPLRIREGGEVAVPGGPDDPIQMIDVRDLTEWIIHLAEQNIIGVYNGSGPDHVLTMKEMVETTKAAIGSDATFTWLGTGFNETHPEAYFPIWTPYEGEYKGFHTFSNANSIKAGLKFRPLADTVTALLAQFDTLPEDKRAEVMARIPVTGEAEMIAAVKEAAE
jgi:2'-hydroxyisoflavone reductase